MGNLSLGPKERLKNAVDFKAAFENGRKVKEEGLLLWIYPNKLGRNRVGFSAPRRTFSRSTQRNRARRLLREAYRRNKNKLRMSFDMIIMLQRKDALSYVESEKGLLALFTKAGLLK